MLPFLLYSPVSFPLLINVSDYTFSVPSTFDAHFHVAQAGLQSAVQFRMALNFRCSHFPVLSNWNYGHAPLQQVFVVLGLKSSLAYSRQTLPTKLRSLPHPLIF